MGLFEDITKNQQLIEMAGNLGSFILERQREKEFNEKTNLYQKEMERLQRQEGSRLSVDSLKKLQNANLAYLSEASKVGKDYERRARELAQANEQMFSNFVKDAMEVTRRVEQEEALERRKAKEKVLSNVITNPEYNEYTMLRRSMTAQELGGEKGKRLADLRRQIVEQSDPNKIASKEVSVLLEAVPFREPRDVSAFLGAQREKEAQYQRIMSAASRALNLSLTVDEARRIRDMNGFVELEKIVKERMKQGYQLPEGISTPEQAVSAFSSVLESDYFKGDTQSRTSQDKIDADLKKTQDKIESNENMQNIKIRAERVENAQNKLQNSLKILNNAYSNKSKTEARSKEGQVLQAITDGIESIIELELIDSPNMSQQELMQKIKSRAKADFLPSYEAYQNFIKKTGLSGLFGENSKDAAVQKIDEVVQKAVKARYSKPNVGSGTSAFLQTDVSNSANYNQIRKNELIQFLQQNPRQTDSLAALQNLMSSEEFNEFLARNPKIKENLLN